MTFSDYNSHSAPLFLTLKILPFTKIVIHRIEMQMYKYYHKTVALVIRELFHDYTHIHQHNIWNFILNKTNINIMSSCALF